MKLIALMATLLMATTVGAQDLSYPELHVTPRASQRIKLETSEEANKNFTSFLPIQLSAITTIAAGYMLSGKVEDHIPSGSTEVVDDGKKAAPAVAMGVGAILLGATTWASMSYRPYKTAYEKTKRNMKRLGKNSKRKMLTIERLAEEEINSLAKMGMRLRYISAATNLALASMLADANEGETDDQKGAQFVSSLSMIMAITPLFFKTRWEEVAEEQEKYKKKIYAPISWAPIMRDPSNKYTATGMSLTWGFN